MKIVIKSILFATILTLFIPHEFSSSIAIAAKQKNPQSNLIRDRKGNIIGINNLTIDKRRYNIKFIYGTFSEIYHPNNQTKTNPTFWQNPQAATQALVAINTALNSRKPISSKLGVSSSKYTSTAFSGSGNSFMIPVSSDRTVREYGTQRTENIYVNGIISSFEANKKAWINYSFPDFSLTPNTPFTYVQINPINN
ncbi:hypothetical protein [Calothrix sp. UHCC 0171]|uniref:hypothetical protein n=1 Tax=Calothrix sp. UHCC 0171 TaxID=3110245 RepID=UPI002B208CA4|nr:hypothetical protein [Calothrix sp. UHCC 0171]MEA5574411.1 hypothetical protein [Calothrix sp. UHCC 0171]